MANKWFSTFRTWGCRWHERWSNCPLHNRGPNVSYRIPCSFNLSARSERSDYLHNIHSPYHKQSTSVQLGTSTGLYIDRQVVVNEMLSSGRIPICCICLGAKTDWEIPSSAIA